MARRFSWGGLQKRSAESDDDDDVEVVEFFSAATTSETSTNEPIKELVQPKKKQRVEERVAEEPAKKTVAPTTEEYVVAGDVNLMTPPTKRRRMLSQSITAMETLIEVIADEDEVLSTRLEYCSNLWRFVREMHPQDVVEFVRQRASSVVRVIEALLHTGYFPLQQLCFMTVAAILYQLHKKDTEVLAAFVVACKQFLSEPDVDLLELLPLREAIPWHDPRVARQRIVQINTRTGLCSSFRVARCWVSPSGKQDLARIRVNKWIDIGSTTTTFYWRDGNDVVVVNVPHSCVEDVEIDKENCVLYIWTKHIDRLKGVRLLAFSSVPADFSGFVKALVGVEIEGYVEPSGSLSTDPLEFGSPIQTMKTASTLVLSGVSPPGSPATTADESMAITLHVAEDETPTVGQSVMVEDGAFEADNAFEPDNSFEPENSFEPNNLFEPATSPDSAFEHAARDGDDANLPRDSFEPENFLKSDDSLAPDVLENAASDPDNGNSDVGDEEIAISEPTADEDSAESVESELERRLTRASRRTSDSLEALHERLDASKDVLTDKFSRVSSARLESRDKIGNREYKLRARVDILQKKRLLELPNAEFEVEDNISRAASDATEHMEDTLDYAAENLIPDEPDLVFTTTSIIMLLVVVIPWVLFAALHSGTDFGSVRQLANDAMVVLAAMLRKLSG